MNRFLDEEDLTNLYSLLERGGFVFKVIKTDMPYRNVYRESGPRDYVTWSVWSYLDALVVLSGDSLIENKRYNKDELVELLEKYNGFVQGFKIGDFPRIYEGLEQRESECLGFNVYDIVNLDYIKLKYPFIYEEFLEYYLSKYGKAKML